MASRVTGLVGRVAAYIVTHPAPRPCAHAVSRATEHVAAPSAVSWPCRRVVSPAVSQPYCASCHDTIVCIVTRLANQTARLSRYKDCIVTQPQQPGPCSCHDTKLCIATLNSSQAVRTHCRPYRAHCTPYCGACSAVSWSSPGRIVAYPLRAHASCVTI